MIPSEDESGFAEPPDIESWLTAFLSVRRNEYEKQYEGAVDDDLTRAIDEIAKWTSDVVTTGVAPPQLNEALSRFKPGDPLDVKLRELLKYSVVLHRLEFDVAEEVCRRLKDVNERTVMVAVLATFLLGYSPSATAQKYFSRAVKLFLAGYDSECVIMCGAVLEAALIARYPNESLLAHGLKPVFKKQGEFSVGQRVRYEHDIEPCLNDEQRKYVGELIDWRNDAVHVQPDLVEDPFDALMNLAHVLPILLRQGGLPHSRDL